MKYWLILWMVICPFLCNAQADNGRLALQGTDSLPHLDMARFVAIDSNARYSAFPDYLLQQGWAYQGWVDNGKTVTYWYDFNHSRNEAGDRKSWHTLHLEVDTAKKTLVDITYKTTSLPQYLDMRCVVMQDGFTVLRDDGIAYGGAVLSASKGPVWVVMVKEIPAAHLPDRYKIDVQLLKDR